MKNEPWNSGPKELLRHGLEHLSLETDFDYPMRMIAIGKAETEINRDTTKPLMKSPSLNPYYLKLIRHSHKTF